MKILIGSDHAGVELRDNLIKKLREKYEIVQSGVPSTSTDDYPDFVFDLAKKMNIKNDYMILICSNGIGMSIAANKVKGIRCGRVCSVDDVQRAKAHNQVNSISFSSKVSLKEALDYVDNLINTEYSSEERHIRRVKKIIDYENGEYNEL